MRWAGHVERLWREEACTGFWWGNLKEGDHLGDSDLDGRIILKWVFRKWIELARDRDRWLALANAVMNLPF